MLTDTFGRKFPYIRMSITDVCNYKCTYCLPKGYKKTPGDTRSFMTCEEIARLTRALSKFCLLYTSPSPRDGLLSRMPSSA